VQGIALTSRLSSMPPTYTDGFAGSLKTFLLQMDTPKWAKSWWFPTEAGDVGGAATETFRGHLFYLACIVVILVTHKLLIDFALPKDFDRKGIPHAFRAPQLQTAVALGICTGTLDVSFEVLTKTEVGAGWRVTAALLIAMVVRVYMYNSDQKEECPSPHQLLSNLNSAVFV
jgi:hypothetical protein